jgi:hypothetical protein
MVLSGPQEKKKAEKEKEAAKRAEKGEDSSQVRKEGFYRYTVPFDTITFG